MIRYHDHATLISHLGGAAEVATGLDTQPVNVRAWVGRNRIPAEYWPGLITFAAGKAVAVSADWLMHNTPARRRSARKIAA